MFIPETRGEHFIGLRRVLPPTVMWPWGPWGPWRWCPVLAHEAYPEDADLQSQQQLHLSVLLLLNSGNNFSAVTPRTWAATSVA